MYRVKLTVEEQGELHRRTREAGIMPRTRDRLEMVRLSAAGWSIPKIAVHLGVDERRVRYWIKRYLEGGFDALPDAVHPGKPSAVTPEMLASIKAEIAKADRTWTARQLAEWVEAEHGLRRSPDQLSRLLKRERIVFKRTGRGLKHKQKPEEVAVKQAELDDLQKRGRRLDRSLLPGRSRVCDDAADDL
jgi:transposase